MLVNDEPADSEGVLLRERLLGDAGADLNPLSAICEGERKDDDGKVLFWSKRHVLSFRSMSNRSLFEKLNILGVVVVGVVDEMSSPERSFSDELFDSSSDS